MDTVMSTILGWLLDDLLDLGESVEPGFSYEVQFLVAEERDSGWDLEVEVVLSLH